MIVSVTGHRPDKLGSYKIPNPIFNRICWAAQKHLLKLNPEVVYTGVALGFDTWIAEICIKNNIPFIAAVPFKGQEKMWPKMAQEQYHYLLSKAKEVVIVSEGEYSAKKMQIRNCFMVDRANVVLACFDGTSGGTKNCVDYAKNLNKEIIIINPKDPNCAKLCQ